MSTTRNRHERSMRGPIVLDSPVTPARPRTSRQRFDAIALRIVRDLDRRWSSRLGLFEFAVDDVPPVNTNWSDAVPLAALIRGSGARPSRLIFYRRPIEHRCSSTDDVQDLVLMVACEQVGELIGVDPREVHPGYRDDL